MFRHDAFLFGSSGGGGGGGGGGADPNLTLALLHFDGANGSTTFTDSSPYNRTVTTFGGAVNSTSQPVFGTSSLYLPDGTSYISLPVAAANFGGSDFCIEMFVKPTSKGAYGKLMGHSLAAYAGFSLDWVYGSDKVRLLSGGYVGSGVWNIDSQSTIDVPLSVNTHLALVRTGQVLRLYIGGQVAIEVDSPLTLWDESVAGEFTVGAGDASNNRFGVGYIDEFRIRKEAVYTGNFTPPTAPFTY